MFYNYSHFTTGETETWRGVTATSCNLLLPVCASLCLRAIQEEWKALVSKSKLGEQKCQGVNTREQPSTNNCGSWYIDTPGSLPIKQMHVPQWLTESSSGIQQQLPTVVTCLYAPLLAISVPCLSHSFIDISLDDLPKKYFVLAARVCFFFFYSCRSSDSWSHPRSQSSHSPTILFFL